MIGIDQYEHGWRDLKNAVNDAVDMLELFKQLGFQLAAEPLLNKAATKDALGRLVSGPLSRLPATDSLVVFVAGHGHTTRTVFADGRSNERGYLIPFDADGDDGDRDTWLPFGNWLSNLAHVPLQHVLVLVDTCHSGLALDYHTTVRPSSLASPSVQANFPKSRRVITSTVGKQSALDVGPVDRHSPFTSYLLEAFQGGLAKERGKRTARVVDLETYVYDRLAPYSDHRQMPASGALELDEGGEFLLPLITRRPKRQRRPSQSGSPRLPPPLAQSVRDAVEQRPASSRTEGWKLDQAFDIALTRHAAQRERGVRVLSVISGEMIAAQTAWATWAARHGLLTLLTDAADPATATADLLAQTPWLRCLPEARKRLAAAAGLDVEAVDASLDSRAAQDRRRWIERVTTHDLHARASGWLLSALRESSARVPDLIDAPAQGSELLAIACDLAMPTTVLFRHESPTAQWLERAIATAAALTAHMHRHSVAVTAPGELVAQVLHGPRDSNALAMARQGRISMNGLAQWSPGRSRSRTIRALFEALSSDRRTRGQFELDGRVELSPGGPLLQADLVASAARIAVELDGWHHFHDPDGYRRDRMQDMRLQSAGYFVMRFLTEDVDDRLTPTIDQIADALVERRASVAKR